MQEVNWDTHPIQSVLGLRGLIQPTDILLLAKYQYIPQTSTNTTRIVVPIRFEDLSPNLVMWYMQSLLPGFELALQSQVYNSKQELVGHLLFADCAGTHEDNKFQESTLKEWRIHHVDVYRSGRSHHLYFPGVLPLNQWWRFLGRLLLWTSGNRQTQLIDERWVGHALEHNYAALRWSANSARHIHTPYLTSRKPLS